MINLKKIVVIGAGTMGSGIAQWFAQQMCEVQLVDTSEEQVKRALRTIHSSWDGLITKAKLTSDQVVLFKNSLTTSALGSVAKGADLVVEAVIEDLEIKRNLFRDLDSYFHPETILASNTSSFPITSMAEAVSSLRKPRFVGLHFFNPATIMKLVEIIKAESTDERLCHDLYKWFEDKAKMPALSKDSPGFIVNRVARNFYGEPLRIATSDDEEKMKEIDRVLRDVGGFKMGPFELMDLIGIDVNYSVTCSVWEAYSREPRFAPHALQRKMVEEKRFGRKSKRGFYQYD